MYSTLSNVRGNANSLWANSCPVAWVMWQAIEDVVPLSGGMQRDYALPFLFTLCMGLVRMGCELLPVIFNNGLDGPVEVLVANPPTNL